MYDFIKNQFRRREMFLAGAQPAGQTPDQMDATITKLRAGMEVQYLGGGMGLRDVGDRFNLGNSATITDHWGITPTVQISYGAAFK